MAVLDSTSGAGTLASRVVYSIIAEVGPRGPIPPRKVSLLLDLDSTGLGLKKGSGSDLGSNPELCK